MASISPTSLAARILALCQNGEAVPDELLRQLADPAIAGTEATAEHSRALFGDLVEPLADRFEPKLCDIYASIFSRVISWIRPEFQAAELVARYRRVRERRRFRDDHAPPERVFVLSRVTLGADVAITSILLDAAKKRFPSAEIILVSSRKSWELFAADSRIGHLAADYRRHGTLGERLSAGLALVRELSRPGSLVLDPDSRLTQLGLLPVCPEDRYWFFESRAAGGDSEESLGQITKRWVAETLGVVDALPYLAPVAPGGEPGAPGIAVSLGVGENSRKRIPEPFEARLLSGLARTGIPILIDKGAGGEEAARVSRAIEGTGAQPGQIETWDGAFAPFAARIARSRLYVGYDSAGQHAAAAAGTPFVTIFAGFPCPRFLNRWSPAARSPHAVIRVNEPNPDTVLQRTMTAINATLAGG